MSHNANIVPVSEEASDVLDWPIEKLLPHLPARSRNVVINSRVISCVPKNTVSDLLQYPRLEKDSRGQFMSINVMKTIKRVVAHLQVAKETGTRND